MTTNTLQTTSKPQQTTLPVEAVPAPGWKEILPLTRVLASIGQDSRKEPQIYLDEVVVPHGGE